MSTEYKEIEIEIEQARSSVERLQALVRLRNNPDFKRIIEQEFFQDYAARLVSLRRAESHESPTAQADLIKDIDGVGTLQQFLNAILTMGYQAEQLLVEGEDALNEIEIGA